MATQVLERLEREASRIGEDAAGEIAGLDETSAAHRALEILGQAGLLAWCVPKSEGGADPGELCPADTVSVRALCTLRRALAYHSGMLDVMLVMQGLGSFTLAKAGDAALRARVLPRVARGERIAAFALTEPGAGSSLGDISARAERTSAGWKLSGAKTFISNAGIAHFYTLLARTSGEPGRSGHEGLSMFLVPADAAGVQATRFEVLAPHPIGDLSLSGVELEGDHLIGEPGAGLELALSCLGRFRTSVAAAAVGFARRALDASRQHLKARRQFGKPLSSFQGLAFDVAEMDTRLRASELLVDEAAVAVDAGREATAEVARAKLYATETASWVCDRAVQHHGGLGVKRGEIVERLFRDVRALRIYEGTSEIQKMILAKKLFSE